MNNLVLLAKLYEKVSQKGNQYLTGRLGHARLVVLRDSDGEAGSDPVWKIYTCPVENRPSIAASSRALETMAATKIVGGELCACRRRCCETEAAFRWTDHHWEGAAV
jgi:hypothetical protein